jgi:hypothetical protein
MNRSAICVCEKLGPKEDPMFSHHVLTLSPVNAAMENPAKKNSVSMGK